MRPDSKSTVGSFYYCRWRLPYARFALNMRSITKLSPSATDPHPSSMMAVPAHIMSVLTGGAPITMHVPAMPARDHSVSLRVVLLEFLAHRGDG